MRHVCPQCGESASAEAVCSRDDVPLVAAHHDALLGETLNRWRLARMIGYGGMARVYLGVQPSIGGRVAIKVLSAELADNPAIVGRFFNEARAVNLISHEHIVDILDLAKLPDGRPYIVMEMLHGVPMSTLMEHRQIPHRAAIAMVVQILEALAAAHRCRIIHRDIKPQNVVVAPSGHIKLLDFGIAKLANEQNAIRTKPGFALGTAGYMSPEQVQALPLDGRSDLYSVGVLLYEVVVGRRPFVGTQLEVLRAHRDDPPVPPSAVVEGVPAALEAVILRALEKSPDARFANAAEMTTALKAILRTLPDTEWTPDVHLAEPKKSEPSTRAHPRVAKQSALVTWALVVGIALMLAVTAYVSIHG